MHNKTLFVVTVICLLIPLACISIGCSSSAEDDPEIYGSFNYAGDPIPPPRSGEVIDVAFPPPDAGLSAPGTITAGPLEVVRYAPEGEIPIAPFLSITFNQPMVPIGTLDQLSSAEVPVTIEPSIPGTWRWLGVKTLTFEYDSDSIDRFPKATNYRVTIPAGTQSTTGGVLAEPVEWTFSTPPPQVTETYPNGYSEPIEPVFLVVFDQNIDREAVLNTIEVKAGKQSMELILASEDDIQNDDHVSRRVDLVKEGYWIAFRTTEPLPTDTAIQVTIGPNTPSAEGPLVTNAIQSYSFRTYAPLSIEDHYCSTGQDDKCLPASSFYIYFNNTLDTTVCDPTMISITPEIPKSEISFSYRSLTISGDTQGQTTYIVEVSGKVQDTFGQTLGEDVTLTFEVGTADPALYGSYKTLITLDPTAASAAYTVYSINYDEIDVEIYAVQPSDWSDYLEYMRTWRRTDEPAKMPGRLVFDDLIQTGGVTDILTEVNIDLGQYTESGFGHFIVVAEPLEDMILDEWYRYYQTIHSWIQITAIGLDAFTDTSEMVVWATALEDGAPLTGITVRDEKGRQEMTTNKDGIIKWDIPSGSNYITASQGADTALLPRSTSYYADSWNRDSIDDHLHWYVFDDRQVYRPGEDVHIKGWLRQIGYSENGDVGLVEDGLNSITYTIEGPRGNELKNGEVEVNDLGGFDFSFTIPESVNLGYASIRLDAEGRLYGISGDRHYHSFQILEFRRPEFEVVTSNQTPGPYFIGDQATLDVNASYYAGGPLPNADVNWDVTYSQGSYSPPNWPEFTFGTWHPWWGWDYGFSYWNSYIKRDTYIGKTDAAGSHQITIDLVGEDDGEPAPISILASAAVEDVNRQTWASTTSLLVHPADLYIGMKSDRYFVEQGKPIDIEYIVTDLDGNPVPDVPVKARAVRLDWKYTDGTWQEIESDPQECLVTSGSEPVSCRFETPEGGEYRISAEITDSSGRANQSQMTRWVSGGDQPPSRDVEQETVVLIPDKEIYQPGDTAELLVQSPFGPAEGMMLVTRNGILYTKNFRIEDSTTTLTIPIKEEYIPNVRIQVDLVGNTSRISDDGELLSDLPPRPAYATGQLNLSIPPVQRTLSLDVTPDARELEPGAETSLSINLTDSSGNPVSDAELAVVVVDEAILALSNYQLADPVAFFYPDRPSYLQSIYSRAFILLMNPETLDSPDVDLEAGIGLSRTTGDGADFSVADDAMAAPAPGEPLMEKESAGRGESSPSTIDIRSNFNPLATFAPEVRTDSNGEARVEVKLPDNLTRYRVMAVAVEGGQRFGMGESSILARKPLMVRPSAPRFLNFGDYFDLPVVLQNQTGIPMQVNVTLEVVNLNFLDGSEQTVTVPSNDRIEVLFPVATVNVGTAGMVITAVSGEHADAARVELPVYTPATTEAFATYGVIDEGTVVQPVASPSGVFSQYGGLEITTSSTALQALTDAVVYLVEYPYGCSEQLASRVLAIAALRDVLTAFEAEGLPSASEIESAVQRDIEQLEGLQNWDGGFPYWRRGFDSIPFNSIHVAHALYHAQEKGFEVDEYTFENAIEYLEDIERHYPHWYSEYTRLTLSAYAVYVRNLAGDQDYIKALNLLAEEDLEDVPMEVIGWLWPVLQDAPRASDELESIRRHVANRIVETAGAANFITEYNEQSYLLLSSDRRTDAILLDALILDDPDSDLIPKLVSGLMAHKSKGRWNNTQENVFVLLALDRYFNTFESETPDFVARIWLGDTYVGSHEFEGYSTDMKETLIPMSYLVDQSEDGEMHKLIMSKEGDGRLYYRLGLRYAPTDLYLDPLDMGFVVQRQYEGVDDPEDVYLDDSSVWHIKAGALVRVKISMVADSRRYHVALADPLPAGLEIVNPELAISQSIPEDPSEPEYRYSWWWSTWYEHQNMRDERAEAFTSLLWDGVYEYSYIARATIPGNFIVPPSKAEEMYSPEVFGRSRSDTVIIE